MSTTSPDENNMQHGAQRRSLPSPEAKQAWQEYQDRVNSDPKNYQVGDHEEDYYCEGYDAATAKLREGLEQEKLDFEKEVSDHYAELHREFKWQLAHQQPSATTPAWPTNDEIVEQVIKDLNLNTTTPDVEKITQNTAHNIDTRLPYGFTNDETDIVEDEVREALAQAHETLVKALKFYAEPGNWINDVLGMPDGHSSEVEGSSEINQDGGMRARAALTDTKENLHDRNQT